MLSDFTSLTTLSSCQHHCYAMGRPRARDSSASSAGIPFIDIPHVGCVSLGKVLNPSGSLSLTCKSTISPEENCRCSGQGRGVKASPGSSLLHWVFFFFSNSTIQPDPVNPRMGSEDGWKILASITALSWDNHSDSLLLA